MNPIQNLETISKLLCCAVRCVGSGRSGQVSGSGQSVGLVGRAGRVGYDFCVAWVFLFVAIFFHESVVSSDGIVSKAHFNTDSVWEVKLMTGVASLITLLVTV